MVNSENDVAVKGRSRPQKERSLRQRRRLCNRLQESHATNQTRHLKASNECDAFKASRRLGWPRQIVLGASRPEGPAAKGPAVRPLEPFP